MLIKATRQIPSSEITAEHLYWSRRAFIRLSAGAVAAAATMIVDYALMPAAPVVRTASAQVPLPNVTKSSSTEALTDHEASSVTTISTSSAPTKRIPRVSQVG
ncbi:MAG: hypothetical protein GEU99_16420 [Luteitalea sp.]|nr:hypothetical protein [Luteitalea sp.]